MSTANVDAMVQAAIRAYRGGDKQEARTLLEKATELDPMHEQAWMWMSAVVEDPDDQKVCLENVIYINPNNQNAKRGLSMLQGKSTSTQAAAAVPEEVDDEPASASPFSEEEDAYAVPTSSVSGNFSASNQPSADEYDDWVSGLGIGESEPQTYEDEDVFDDNNAFSNIFSEAFDDEVEEYEPEPVSSSSTSTFEEVASDMFGFDDDMFEEDFEDEDDFGLGSSMDDSSSAFTDGPFTSEAFNFEDDDLLEPSKPSRERAKSPVSPSESSSRSASPSPSENRQSSGIFTDTGAFNQYDTGTIDSTDPEYYFRQIPRNIKPTRAPGVKSAPPALMLGGVAVLILANIGAIVLLIGNLG